MISYSLEELAIKGKLSKRSVNVCTQNGLLTLEAILQFWTEHKSFKKLKYCGVVSEVELFAIFLNYYEKLGSKIADRINRHISFLSSIYGYNFSKIIQGLVNDHGISKFILVFNKHHFQRLKRHDIGKKYLNEFIEFKKQLQKYIAIILYFKEDQFSTLYLKYVVDIYVKRPSSVRMEILRRVVDGDGKILLFSLIDILVQSDYFFDREEQILFRDIFNQRTFPKRSARFIKIKENRERKIRKQLKENISFYFSFLNELKLQDYRYYFNTTSRDYFIVDQKFADKINEIEGVNFTLEFYSLIFSLLMKQDYKLLNKWADVSAKIHIPQVNDFSNHYLISRNLFSFYNFNAFFSDLFQKTSENRVDDISINFKDYIQRYFVGQNKSIMDKILQICSIIVRGEFNIKINAGKLLLPKNKGKTLAIMIKEVFVEKDEMLDLQTIVDSLIKKFPEKKFLPKSVLIAINNNKSTFLRIGIPKSYGLKIWEKSKENIKGGAVNSLARELIMQVGAPVDRECLMSYILKYRNTTKVRIFNLLRMSKNPKFVFNKNGTIGLP